MSIRTIACCTDFSPHADQAVAAAIDMAVRCKAKLYILHVMPPLINPVMEDAAYVPPEIPRESLLVKLEAEMQRRYGESVPLEVDYELVVRDGHVSSEILSFLEEQGIDLAVVGAFGLSGMGLVLFGSVAKRLAHKAPCSVMIVRSPKSPS